MTVSDYRELEATLCSRDQDQTSIQDSLCKPFVRNTHEVKGQKSRTACPTGAMASEKAAVGAYEARSA